jgi:Domain of unknown function (DUF4773)
VCFAVPYLEKAASLCIDFYNLDLANKTFSGCVKMQARLAHVVVESVDFGCFHIPLRKPYLSHDFDDVDDVVKRRSSESNRLLK